MLYDGWHGPVRVLVVGGLAYLALVALLRISGKRTLAKLNAFDLILTVALGSTLATVLLTLLAQHLVEFGLGEALPAQRVGQQLPLVDEQGGFGAHQAAEPGGAHAAPGDGVLQTNQKRERGDALSDRDGAGQSGSRPDRRSGA
ncbi:MAG: hypothetical protein M3P96_13010 [Actinomycetota bacterium]|nr:hypothetical protein [Actinomycetota bacterium]